MKLTKNFCLNKILFKNGSCQVKSYVTRSNHEKKKHSVRSRGLIFSAILKKISQNVCLDEISKDFENKCVISGQKLGHYVKS